MNTLGTQRIHQEISRTQDVIFKTLEVKPTLFAPPSGAFNQRVVQIADSSFQMKTILWTADTIDWQKPSPAYVINKISRKMENGVLVLMHPTSTSEASLDQLLTIAKRRGYSRRLFRRLYRVVDSRHRKYMFIYCRDKGSLL